MSTKVALRGRNQEAYRRWTANRDDCITAHGLDSLMANAMMPTLDTVKIDNDDVYTDVQVRPPSRSYSTYSA